MSRNYQRSQGVLSGTKPTQSTHSNRTITSVVKEWTGYLVVNADRMVLGVYGSAIRGDADRQVAKLKAAYPFAEIRVLSVTMPKRPSVGDYIASTTNSNKEVKP
jgi:hypothetical protein